MGSWFFQSLLMECVILWVTGIMDEGEVHGEVLIGVIMKFHMWGIFCGIWMNFHIYTICQASPSTPPTCGNSLWQPSCSNPAWGRGDEWGLYLAPLCNPSRVCIDYPYAKWRMLLSLVWQGWSSQTYCACGRPHCWIKMCRCPCIGSGGYCYYCLVIDWDLPTK